MKRLYRLLVMAGRDSDLSDNQLEAVDPRSDPACLCVQCDSQHVLAILNAIHYGVEVGGATPFDRALAVREAT